MAFTALLSSSETETVDVDRDLDAHLRNARKRSRRMRAAERSTARQISRFAPQPIERASASPHQCVRRRHSRSAHGTAFGPLSWRSMASRHEPFAARDGRPVAGPGQPDRCVCRLHAGAGRYSSRCGSKAPITGAFRIVRIRCDAKARGPMRRRATIRNRCRPIRCPNGWTLPAPFVSTGQTGPDFRTRPAVRCSPSNGAEL